MLNDIQGRSNSALYRAIWRWHFIAGLVVLPFILLLAVTGAIYLFKDEINDTAHRNLRFVEPAESITLTPSQITKAAIASHPGELKAYTAPSAKDRSAEVDILGVDGLKDTVYVDPYSGTVLGSLWDGGPAGSPAMYVVRKLHSLEYVGWFGNRVIEAAAGWMVVLVITGIYLWWPRGRKVGTFSIKAKQGRPWWRDMHAVTGLYAGAVIVFMAMTGLPWSSVWGGKFYDYAYSFGLGIPDGYWSDLPVSSQPMSDAVDHAPWIMQNQPLPLSGAETGLPRTLDAVATTVEAMGIAPGYTVSLPAGRTGVFTASVYPDDIDFERVIHLDQYSGEVLYDAGLADLGTLGRWSEWGISVHMGQEFGLVNQIVLLSACVAMVMLCISGAAMWWKRRPAGTLGLPQVPADWSIPRNLLLVAIALGIFFPLVGLSMLAMAGVEWAIYLSSRRPQRAR
ncbi:PepSY-associated TM helix domain-containing protein [Leisingera caerulea]|uniref:PepSY-associated TM helix domain-containing protein n=1 Tax=Leisingera caerulea TaxID=506591 RepID=UPI000406DB35|nr:PepSY domain-containing protein [Leisingera caerulea]